jgi:hypothetical protein
MSSAPIKVGGVAQHLAKEHADIQLIAKPLLRRHIAQFIGQFDLSAELYSISQVSLYHTAFVKWVGYGVIFHLASTDSDSPPSIWLG